jgi:hypothetical protein
MGVQSLKILKMHVGKFQEGTEETLQHRQHYVLFAQHHQDRKAAQEKKVYLAFNQL